MVMDNTDNKFIQHTQLYTTIFVTATRQLQSNYTYSIQLFQSCPLHLTDTDRQ